MKHLGLALLVLLGCQHDAALERKVDQLNAELAQTAKQQTELDRKLDIVIASLAARPATDVLDRKVEELTKKLDQLAANAAAAAAPLRHPRPEPDPAKTYAIAVSANDPVEGPADAKVTLVEAFDYACPYCERNRDTLVQLRQKYGKDLRIVWMPMVVHPQVAMAGALAACAANRQKKFAQLDALLWEKGFKGRQFDKDDPTTGEKCWESAAGCPVILGFARELPLDIKRFQSDMKDCSAVVQAEMKRLTTFGVGATPSFFINGRFMAGAMPVENFSAVIDEELAKATERIARGTPKAKYYDKWVVDQGEKSLAGTAPIATP